MMKKAFSLLTACAVCLCLAGCGNEKEKPNFKTLTEEIRISYNEKQKADRQANSEIDSQEESESKAQSDSEAEEIDDFAKYIQDNLTVTDDGSTLTFKFNNVDFNSYYEHYKDNKDDWETQVRLILLSYEYNERLEFIEMLNSKLGVPESVLSRIKSSAETYESGFNAVMSAAGQGDPTQKAPEEHIEFTEKCDGFTVSFVQDKESNLQVNAVLTYTVE